MYICICIYAYIGATGGGAIKVLNAPKKLASEECLSAAWRRGKATRNAFPRRAPWKGNPFRGVRRGKATRNVYDPDKHS